VNRLSCLEGLDIQVIPLRPNSKKPLSHTWSRTLPTEQWNDAPTDANLGLIPGGGFCAIDADDSETAADVGRWLASLGYPVPVSQTPRGAHFWIHSSVPEGFSIGLLRDGRGELRARRCYLVEPESFVDGRPYTWLRGGPEIFAALPLMEWLDVGRLVATAERPAEEIAFPPFPLLKREPSGRILGLLAALRTAPKGEPIEAGGKVYPTRSEAEIAAVCSFIVLGYSFEEVIQWFERFQPAHYIQRGKRRREYLEGEYRRALALLRAHKPRRGIEKLYSLANSQPWPGRTGLFDLAALNAVYSIAWQAGTLEPRVTVRDVALASASMPNGRTASHALRRLVAAGWLRRWAVGNYSLLQPQTLAPLTLPPVSYASSMTHSIREDSETWGKMGRTCGTVYGLLGSEAVGITELAKRTGKTVRTVYRALEQLQSFDLAVTAGRGLWIRGTGSLRAASTALHASEAGRARRRVVERQREAFREGAIRWRAEHDREEQRE
jgi:hypothetical protein